MSITRTNAQIALDNAVMLITNCAVASPAEAWEAVANEMLVWLDDNSEIMTTDDDT